jgi:hypothetical protein
LSKDYPLTCVRNEALLDFDGFARFFIYQDGSSSVFQHKQINSESETTVKVRRFDSLGLPVPDLLVIDAQSAEYRILLGFGELLKSIKYIVLETGFYSPYNTSDNFDKIYTLLKSSGFKFVASNVSGKGIFRFLIMRIRGVLHNVRSKGMRHRNDYSGFFDVIFENRGL